MAEEALRNSNDPPINYSNLAEVSSRSSRVVSLRGFQNGIAQTHLSRSDSYLSRISYQASSGYNSTHDSALLHSNGYTSILFDEEHFTPILTNEANVPVSQGNYRPILYSEGNYRPMLYSEGNYRPILYSEGNYRPMLYSEGNYRPMLCRERNDSSVLHNPRDDSVMLNNDENSPAVMHRHRIDTVLSHRPSRLDSSQIHAHLDIQTSSRSSDLNVNSDQTSQAQVASGESLQATSDHQRSELAGNQDTDSGNATAGDQNSDNDNVITGYKDVGNGDVITGHQNINSDDVTEQKRPFLLLDDGAQQNQTSTPDVSTGQINIGENTGARESEIIQDWGSCNSLVDFNWPNLITKSSQHSQSLENTINYSNSEQWTHRQIVGTETAHAEIIELQTHQQRTNELNRHSLGAVNDRLSQDVLLGECRDHRSSHINNLQQKDEQTRSESSSELGSIEYAGFGLNEHIFTRRSMHEEVIVMSLYHSVSNSTRSESGLVEQDRRRDSQGGLTRFDNRSTENSYQHNPGFTLNGLLVAQESSRDSHRNLTQFDNRSTENSYQHNPGFTLNGLLVAQESSRDSHRNLTQFDNRSTENSYQHNPGFTLNGFLVAQESSRDSHRNLTWFHNRSTENSYQDNLINNTVESCFVTERNRGSQHEFERTEDVSTVILHQHDNVNVSGLSSEARPGNSVSFVPVQPAAGVVGASNRPAVSIGIILRRNYNDGINHYHGDEEGAVGGFDPQNPPFQLPTDVDIHNDGYLHALEDEATFIDIAGTRYARRYLHKCATCFQNPRQTRNFTCECICNCLDCSLVMRVCAICQENITDYEVI